MPGPGSDYFMIARVVQPANRGLQVSGKIQAVRGMNDILPEHSHLWQFLEDCTREALESAGYREIRLPLVERTALFSRAIGEVTDIVEKEMYTFEDRNGDSLTLRPEGTAGCVRAGIERGLFHNSQPRLWYSGPMFRHERPQKGRYRQFHQIGVEAYGMDGPDVDAEQILLLRRLWERLGIRAELRLNSLGTPEARRDYRAALVRYFEAHAGQLDEDSQRRLHTNPMRILDSKNPALFDLIDAAPRLPDYLDDESREHFSRLCRLLDDAGVEYVLDPRLVRGLDYYTRTVFEWVTDALGAQDAVCSGGRYDGLVTQLGGRPTPAVGFALGMERVIALIEQQAPERPPRMLPHVYVVHSGEQAERLAFEVSELLREQVEGLRLMLNCGGGSFKAQFRRADNSGAAVALVIGEEEAGTRTVQLKPLREHSEQQAVKLEALPAAVAALIN